MKLEFSFLHSIRYFTHSFVIKHLKIIYLENIYEFITQTHVCRCWKLFIFVNILALNSTINTRHNK